MTSRGQKVTTGPESKREVGEAGGLVTSDSLAAESVRDGGSFGSGNERIDVSQQPSYSTTTNTTDTSSARRLDPAVDAEAREAQSSWNEQAEQAELDIQPRDKTSGIGPTYNTAEKAGGGHGAASGGYGGGGARGERRDVDAAPTYVDVNQNPNYYRDGEAPKPHGKNITEGGFDSGAPNASFNTTDIGGKGDPGRAAVRKTERSAGDAGYPEDTGSAGKGQYGDLGEERA